MQKTLSKIKAVQYSDWPKPTLRQDIGRVARIESGLDAIATSLSIRSKLFIQKATKQLPEIRYRAIFLILSHGGPAVLTEYSHQVGKIDLSLPVERDTFAFDDDYAEVVTALGLSAAQVTKFEGNFTWLPHRKSKRLERKDELPEDWWNHVHVPSDKANRKA